MPSKREMDFSFRNFTPQSFLPFSVQEMAPTRKSLEDHHRLAAASIAHPRPKCVLPSTTFPLLQCRFQHAPGFVRHSFKGIINEWLWWLTVLFGRQRSLGLTLAVWMSAELWLRNGAAVVDFFRRTEPRF
jgi:hypothetical protein